MSVTGKHNLFNVLRFPCFLSRLKLKGTFTWQRKEMLLTITAQDVKVKLKLLLLNHATQVVIYRLHIVLELLNPVLKLKKTQKLPMNTLQKETLWLLSQTAQRFLGLVILVP